MNILRKYKIYKLFNCLNEDDKNIFLFLDFWFENLVIFESPYYPDSIFYMTANGRFVFEKVKKNNDIIFRWRDLLQTLEIDYKIYYYDLLVYILKRKYKINMESLIGKDYGDLLKIEYEFDKKIQNLKN